tara:strand:- start:310 stop:1044 length:735 start_codon:yes stop_codon:yes gene_type:complete
MPRAGNTLLGSLINQTNFIKVTPNSVAVEMVHRIMCLNETEIYKNFPDRQGLIDSARAALFSYYEHYYCSFILDRGDWGKPGNLQYLKDLNIPRKFVILYRPVFECLASTLKAMNSFDEKLCDDLMSTKLNLGNYIWSIENIIKSNEDYLIVTYDQLVSDPQKTIDNIFNFIGAPKYQIRTQEFSQFNINNLSYFDDDVPWHTIRTDKIEKNKYDYMSLIPTNIALKYKNVHDNLENLIKMSIR